MMQSKSPHPPVGTFSHAQTGTGEGKAIPFSCACVGEGARRADEGSLAMEAAHDLAR
jgi:hypothetical protein